jgi:hypothetical protein
MFCKAIERHQHAIACVVSCLLTWIGLYALSRVPAPFVRGNAAHDDEPLTVVWIERRPVPTPQPRIDAEPVTSTNVRSARSKHVRPQLRHPSASADEESVVDQSVADKQVSKPSHQAPFNLRLEEPRIAITTGADANINRITVEDLKASEVLSVEVRDRSVGAFLSNRVRAIDCGELRAALANRPESTYVIIESMRKRGCK